MKVGAVLFIGGGRRISISRYGTCETGQTRYSEGTGGTEKHQYTSRAKGQKKKNLTQTHSVRFRFLLAEMGECRSCTQHPVLLNVAILYHRKSYMSIVFHSGICDSIHFQKIFSRCLSQLSGTNDLSEQRSHLILMISTPILVIEGFDPEAVHLHHAFSRT